MIQPRVFFYVAIALTACAGCGQTREEVKSISWENVVFELSEIRANQAGLEYSLRRNPSGFIENEVMALEVSISNSGFVIDFRNKSEFMLFLNWSKCALVDYQNVSYCVLDPEIDLTQPGRRLTDVLPLAPFASKKIYLVPTKSLVKTPEAMTNRSLHPPYHEVLRIRGFRERIILWIVFRDSDLMYDITVSFRLKPAIPTSNPVAR